MSGLTLERKIQAAFGAGLLLLAVVAWFGYRGMREMQSAAERVAHTHAVIALLEAAAFALNEAESGQRGYVLTGDELELERYAGSEAELWARLDSLADLIADSPAQAARLDSVRPLIGQRVDLLRIGIDLRQEGGLASVAEAMAASPGRALMRQVRDDIDVMVAAEERLLRPRVEHADAVSRQTRAVVVGGGLWGLLFVTAASLVIGRELRERRRAEAESARLASIVESSADSIIGLTLDGMVTSWNQGAERIWGYTEEEAVGRPVTTLVPPGPGEMELEDAFDALRRGEGRDHVETVRVARDRRRVQISLMISPLRDRSGKVVGAAAIARDITARRRAETRFGAVLDAATENAIIGTDESGVITIFNRGAERMLGYRAEEVIGRHSPALFHDREEVAARAADLGLEPGFEVFVHAARAGGTETREWTYIRRDGKRITVSLSVSPLLEAGEIRGFIGIADDVTERREIERMKDEFVSVVSHELRTPLTSIRGALGLLAGGKLGAIPEKAARMIEVAANNTDRLVRLINDILDVEKLQSGKVELRVEPLEIQSVVLQAVEELRAMADRSGVELFVSVPPATVEGDRDRLVQVFGNLLSNAIKFSTEGDAVEVEGRAHDGHVEVWVRDRGRGIPEDKLESIFGRFQQVDASDSREKGGTGLGLAITRELVQQHGGEVWAESEPGKGSTFRVRLPLPHVVAEPAPVAGQGAAEAPLVLCCDDDPAYLEVISEVLRQRGYRVRTSMSAEQMLELARIETPDVVLLDLLLPGASGWDAMGSLKSDERTASIPVVVLSALAPDPSHPLPDADGWVVKTAGESELFRTLDRSLANDLELQRVLVVEDDPDLAKVLCATFAERGLDVAHAASGREAIELSQQTSPQVLVLDLLLPEGSGFEVVDWLRHHDRLGSIALVVYTALDLGAEDRERLQLGETRVLTKSRAAPDDVAAQVSELLRRVAAPQEG